MIKIWKKSWQSLFLLIAGWRWSASPKPHQPILSSLHSVCYSDQVWPLGNLIFILVNLQNWETLLGTLSYNNYFRGRYCSPIIFASNPCLSRTNQSTKKIKVRHRLLSKHCRLCKKASKKCFTGQTSFHLTDGVGEIDDLGLLEHHSDIRKNKVRFYYSKREDSWVNAL